MDSATISSKKPTEYSSSYQESTNTQYYALRYSFVDGKYIWVLLNGDSNKTKKLFDNWV